MDGKVVIKIDTDTKSFDAQISKVESELQELEQRYKETAEMKAFKGQEEDLKELELEIEKTKNKLVGLYQQQAKVNNQGFSNVHQTIQNVGNSMDNVIKKAVKWGLAIFSIRSVYTGIRQAVSQLMQEDENLKWQVDYMKFALGQAIKPVVEWIVNLVHQILVWLGAIIKILFGINIFSNATVDNFKKANSNAQKLKKTLAGFDEMNILNENGTTGALGGISNALKGWDLAKEVDELADKLKPFEEKIKAIAILALGIFGASVIAKWIGNIGGFLSSSSGAAGLSSTLAKLGIIAGGIIITGLVAKNVWDEAQQLKEKIQEINKKGKEAQQKWLENEEDINKILTTQNVNRTAGYNLLNQSSDLLNKITGIDKELLETAKQTATNMNKQVDKAVELNRQGKLNKEQQNAVKNEILETIKYNDKLIEYLKKNGQETKEIEALNRNLTNSYKDMGGDVNAVYKLLGGINALKLTDKELTVNVTANTVSFEKAIENAMKYGSSILGGLGAGTWGAIAKYKRAKGGIFYPSKLPKLAAGGIINNPGAGIPYNGAIIGERGAEAVLPLTDSQQMALLGETIGKYINVNLTNITELDGRTIARKVDKVRDNTNFLMNR